MIFDILDMLMTYVQYLSLLVGIAPETLPTFYGDTIDVIKYFVLNLMSSFSESNRYSNPLRVVLPEWLPLDVRLQFVIVVIAAPLALATLGLLVVFNKLAYLWFLVVLGALFCFVFGALLVANSGLYSDHPEPSKAARISLLSVGLPVFLGLAILAAFFLMYMKRRVAARQQVAHNGYVQEELHQREAKSLTYELVDREHLDADLLAAERARRAQKQARITTLNRWDVGLQAFVVVCLCIGGFICIGVIPVPAMGKLQGSTLMMVAGIILLVFGGLCLIWLVLSLFTKGRRIRIAVSDYFGGFVLTLVMIGCSSLYTTIVTTFVSVLYCSELTCTSGSRPPHTSALFPYSAVVTTSSKVAVGCSACDIDAYPQQCPAAWRESLCNGTVRQPRLTYDARVLCSQVDGFYRVSAAIMFAVYMLFVPILQLVLACYGVDLLRRRFPLESRAVEMFRPLELYYEKVLTSGNHASFMYNAYKASFRYYRLTFLMQKVIMALISCTTERGEDVRYAWVGLMLFMIIPLLAVVCAIVFRPFSRPTETALFPTLQSLVALFAMVLLIAERTHKRLSYGVGVLLLVLAVAIPVLTLIIGTVLTLRMERRRYDLLLLRLQLVMNKAATGSTKASITAPAAGGMYSTAGTCDASQLHHNWLERLVLRFVNWLDPEMTSLQDSTDLPRLGSHMSDNDEARRGAGEEGATVELSATATPAAGQVAAAGGAGGGGLRHHGAFTSRHHDPGDAFSLSVDGHPTTSDAIIESAKAPAAAAESGATGNAVPRRERKRAVVLDVTAEEQAAEATRRYQQAREREARGEDAEDVNDSEEKAAVSYWRRFFCCCPGIRSPAAAEDGGDVAKGKTSTKLFAMTGDRAALRARSLSKLERRVPEYDTGDCLFVPEAYFLRCYYPDDESDGGAGGHGAHGRFWSLFTDLMRPTVQRHSNITVIPEDAHDTNSPDQSVVLDALPMVLVTNPITKDDKNNNDNNNNNNATAPPPRTSDAQVTLSASSPQHRSRTLSVGHVDSVGSAVGDDAVMDTTVRHRRANARAQRREGVQWSDEDEVQAFAGPPLATTSFQSYDYSASFADVSADMDVTVFSSPDKFSSHGRTYAADPWQGIAGAGGGSGANAAGLLAGRHGRARHRFQLPESPSYTSYDVSVSPSFSSHRYSAYGPVMTTESVFPADQVTDAFLFAANELTPRRSDSVARRTLSPSYASGAVTTPGASRVSTGLRGSPAVSRRPFLSVSGALGPGGGGPRSVYPTWSRSHNARTAWPRGSLGNPAGTDVGGGGSEDEEDVVAESPTRRMTCVRAVKLFFVRVWHMVQEWLGVRSTQDAVLKRLQQRDGLSGRGHTLLTYPVVFRKRQQVQGLRAVLASTAIAGDAEGSTDLPYARPYWRRPSTAMLGVADIRGSTMPWFLRTVQPPPMETRSGASFRLPHPPRSTARAVPCADLTLFGLIERARDRQAAASSTAPPLTALLMQRDSGPDRRTSNNTRKMTNSTHAGDDRRESSTGAPPDVAATRLRRSVPPPRSARPSVQSPETARHISLFAADDSIIILTSDDDDEGEEKDTPTAPAKSMQARAGMPPALTVAVQPESTSQAVAWANYCLTVGEEMVDGFDQIWRDRRERAPVTVFGRREEYSTTTAEGFVPPPSDSLHDARFVEVLREVLLPDAVTDSDNEQEEDAQTSRGGGGGGGQRVSAHKKNEVDGDKDDDDDKDDDVHATDGGALNDEPVPSPGRAGHRGSVVPDLFVTDAALSPTRSPAHGGGARWEGVNAATSGLVAAALITGRPQRLSLSSAADAVLAYAAAPVATTAKGKAAEMASGGVGSAKAAQSSRWDTWLSPGTLAPGLSASTRGSATGATGASADKEDDTAVFLRLLRCRCLLRERLADFFWAQRRRLRHVQSAVNFKIDRVVRLFLGFLFLWLGLLACLCFALVFGGMLNTVDDTFITGTSRDDHSVSYQLAGYDSWENFTAHCCCTAASDLNASFPFYALDVEDWLCENGQVKERVRRDGFDDDVHSGYRVRSLCGMTFLNGCALQSVGHDSVAVTGCALTNITEYELERW